MDYQTLTLETPQTNVLRVTLNRPKALNALNTQMGRELHELWTRPAAEPGETRCAVLTGSGERAFCAGADLKERDGMAQADWQVQHELFERGFMALMEFPLPVIAALNGHAFGGGPPVAPTPGAPHRAPPARRRARAPPRSAVAPGLRARRRPQRAPSPRRPPRRGPRAGVRGTPPRGPSRPRRRRHGRSVPRSPAAETP